MISQHRDTLAHYPNSGSALIRTLAIRESTLIPIMTIAVHGQELVKRAAK
jgi:hypothetical protein